MRLRVFLLNTVSMPVLLGMMPRMTAGELATALGKLYNSLGLHYLDKQAGL
jgi:hypothetical protein